MAALIKERYGIKARLVPGGSGDYEIRVGDTEVFSKKKMGRFPDDDEVFSKMDEILPT